MQKHGGFVKCIKPECKTGAASGYDTCVKHGAGPRCAEPGCKTGARHGYDRCAAHKGGARCPNCITWPDSRAGNPKYDNHCITCFKRLFPLDARSKRTYEHTKELRVQNAINEVFKGFIHDRPLYTGNCDCTHRRRVDQRKLIGNTILAIETDEFGHSSYNAKDEEIRYDDLYMIYSGKWIFIRFNPDSKGVDLEDKLQKLIETMHEVIERIDADENTELLEIIKLF